jgi:hypothetical protein
MEVVFEFHPHCHRKITLRVRIDNEYSFSGIGEKPGKSKRRGGLRHTTLLVRDYKLDQPTPLVRIYRELRPESSLYLVESTGSIRIQTV